MSDKRHDGSGSVAFAADRIDGRLLDSLLLLEGVFRDMLDAVLLADARQRIVGANPAALALFEYDADTLIGEPLAMLDADTPARDRPGHDRIDAANRVTPPHQPHIRAYRSARGRLFDGETRRGILGDDTADQPLTLMIVRDVSERIAIDRATARLHDVASSQHMGFDERVHEMLRIGCDLFELPIGVLSHIKGETYEIVDVIHPDDGLAAGSLFDLRDTYCASTLAAGGPIAYHDVSRHEIRHQSCYATFGLESYIGSPVWVDAELYGTLCFSSTVPRRPFPAQHLQFAGLIAQWLGHELARRADYLALCETRDRLRVAATTDDLTGLANRRRLGQLLDEERGRTRRYGAPFSVLLIDFDHFKAINDRHGHGVGDEALQLFARVATEALRTTDTVGRWGGEEFLVVLPNTDTDGARRLAERVADRIRSTPLPTADAELALTVSIGIVAFDGAEKIDALVSRADRALYQAKASGRDRVAMG